MSETIQKYVIGKHLSDEIVIQMPAPAIVLSVSELFGHLTVWARVDSGADDMERHLCIRGIGHPFKGNEGDFIGTVRMPNDYVWHVFYMVN